MRELVMFQVSNAYQLQASSHLCRFFCSKNPNIMGLWWMNMLMKIQNYEELKIVSFVFQSTSFSLLMRKTE